MNQIGTPLLTLIGIIGAGIIGYFVGTSTGMGRMHNEMLDDNSMHSMMSSMTGSLSGKTGDAFDQAFLREMIVHHEGAVVMAQMVLETSSRPELRQLATEIITAQNKEIEQMKNWGVLWFTQ